MNIDNITKGEWMDYGDYIKVAISEQVRSTVVELHSTKKENKANSKLIIEAANVAQETGLSPRELQQQNNELREALKQALNTLENEGYIMTEKLLKEEIAKHQPKK